MDQVNIVYLSVLILVVELLSNVYTSTPFACVLYVYLQCIIGSTSPHPSLIGPGADAIYAQVGPDVAGSASRISPFYNILLTPTPPHGSAWHVTVG
ncbi:hypothetical protein F5888DRAFT_455990 [Russula emetica]|nr:hypothetical protein F5888DRAFT_455990 [Russula emetica]